MYKEVYVRFGPMYGDALFCLCVNHVGPYRNGGGIDLVFICDTAGHNSGVCLPWCGAEARHHALDETVFSPPQGSEPAMFTHLSTSTAIH